jgi:LPXTG-motif cell wall-anchored protein
VPLGFNPTAVAPPPVLTITPVGPFTDGQQVEVHGSGFSPDADLGMSECLADGVLDGSRCDSSLYDVFSSDGNGEFTRTVTLHTKFAAPKGDVDCTTAPNGCVLFAANRQDFGDERTSIPIPFATGSGPTPTQTIRALAFTGAGSSTAPLAVVGALAVALGAALLVTARRRRATS